MAGRCRGDYRRDSTVEGRVSKTQSSRRTGYGAGQKILQISSASVSEVSPPSWFFRLPRVALIFLLDLVKECFKKRRRWRSGLEGEVRSALSINSFRCAQKKALRLRQVVIMGNMDEAESRGQVMPLDVIQNHIHRIVADIVTGISRKPGLPVSVQLKVTCQPFGSARNNRLEFLPGRFPPPIDRSALNSKTAPSRALAQA